MARRYDRRQSGVDNSQISYDIVCVFLAAQSRINAAGKSASATIVSFAIQYQRFYLLRPIPCDSLKSEVFSHGGATDLED